MNESILLKRILLALNSRKDVRVFRNNVGVAQTANGSVIRYGLMVGSGDLIGWKTHRVTESDVGKDLAVFVSVEVKTSTGRVSDAQKIWMEQVNKHGGIAIVARDEDIKL